MFSKNKAKNKTKTTAMCIKKDDTNNDFNKDIEYIKSKRKRLPGINLLKTLAKNRVSKEETEYINNNSDSDSESHCSYNQYLDSSINRILKDFT